MDIKVVLFLLYSESSTLLEQCWLYMCIRRGVSGGYAVVLYLQYLAEANHLPVSQYKLACGDRAPVSSASVALFQGPLL